MKYLTVQKQSVCCVHEFRYVCIAIDWVAIMIVSFYWQLFFVNEGLPDSKGSLSSQILLKDLLCEEFLRKVRLQMLF